MAKHNESASFDVVGKYNQDDVNGYGEGTLVKMIEAIDPVNSEHILDAMGGDGNLSEKIIKYCNQSRSEVPKITFLEYSRVQTEFAKKNLSHNKKMSFLWGDILSLRERDGHGEVPRNSYDKVVIKSANHEIPQSKQGMLYNNIFDILTPGGTFINLGMVFEDENERREMKHIANVKDSLAGMTEAVKNRHFLTRNEFYGYLRDAGFEDINTYGSFNYTIASSIVRDTYFKNQNKLNSDVEFQISQIRATEMRKSGKITFRNDESVMMCPGEITVAHKPSIALQNSNIYKEYPYDFLRNIACHRQMLELATSYVSPQSKTVDIGCGLGLAFEHLIPKKVFYTGLDFNQDFTGTCSERYAQYPDAHFETVDAVSYKTEEKYDNALLLNVLYQPNINPITILKNTHELLADKGKIVVSGPLSPESYRQAEPHIIEQLKVDKKYSQSKESMAEIRKANDKLLREHGNYWSAEGMIELLKKIGFSKVVTVRQDLYYGNSYLVVAEK